MASESAWGKDPHNAPDGCDPAVWLMEYSAPLGGET